MTPTAHPAAGRTSRLARALRPARLAEGAALGVLAWLAADQLGGPRLVGIQGTVGFAIGTAAGALLGRWRPRAVRGVAVLVGAAYGVVVATPLARVLLPSVVRRDPVATRPAVDAVAVLSSDLSSDGLLGIRGVERLLAGAAWARALDRPLVLAVVRDPGRPRAASSEADQRALAALAGVRRLYFVDSVRVTRDEAVREAALARREGWARLLVVTSASHSRRACATYERAGLRVTCAPAPARTYALGGAYRVTGPRERTEAFRDWIYEAVGWAVYRARGWV